MSRYIAVFLAFVMIVSLCGCSRVENGRDTFSEKESEDGVLHTDDEDSPDAELIVSEEPKINIPQPKKTEKPDFGELSDDLYSFQAEINGEVYQFPMRYSEFISYGWKLDGVENDKIDANYYRGHYFILGELECYVQIVNFDINAHPIKECYIGGISVDFELASYDKDFSMRMPKSIELGKSTVEDVKKAYGTPSYSYEGEYLTELEYKYSNNYQEVIFEFSTETGILKKIQIRNFEKPEDFVEGEVSTEVPDIVKRYKTPEKLEDDFSLFIVQYGGDYYQLPAPVSCFIANGWKIIENETEMVIAGRDNGWVTLMKDNQKLSVIAQNYTETAATIENCFVTTVESGTYGNNTKIKIARGITIGMKESKLEQALSGVDYEKDT